MRSFAFKTKYESNEIYFRCAGSFWYLKINLCNAPYQEINEEKSWSFQFTQRKHFKNSALMIENCQHARNRGDLPRVPRSINLHPTYWGQIHAKPVRSGRGKRSAAAVARVHKCQTQSALSDREKNKKEQREMKAWDWKGGNETIGSCTGHDCLHRGNQGV